MTALIDSLDDKTLEALRREGAEGLLWIHSTGSLADELRAISRFFEITSVQIVDGGLGIIGLARMEAGAPSDLAVLLELAVHAMAETAQAATQQLREAERALRRRTIELLEADRRNTDAKADKEAYERKLRLAQLQTDKVRGTLSFRLGHALIHKTKSAKGVLELPSALWKLQQDASERREREGAETGLRRFVRRIAQLRDKPLVVGQRSAPIRREVAPVIAFPPPFPIERGEDLRALRVAGIFDEFTASSFAPECELTSLHANSWLAQLAEARPHLLFVESAWNGAGGSWDRKINQLAKELRELVQHCREAGIPTVFWNKEDPVHFGTFLNTAALFDVVFTTDFDCIHRYRELLGHDRVYLLPFAAQPRVHNPIEKYERKDAACFAGAYYARYPERQRDFLRILIKLLERGAVEIFDRNYGKTDPDYQFPASYRDYIVGNLPFSEIDRAYKGYRYAININTIKTSQTMFARRVFELLASNTLTVSNYAKGIRVMFGDLVVATDDAARLGARLAELEDPALARAVRLTGLRKAMAEHTYQDRLAYLATKVFDIEAPRLLPVITVVGTARDEAAIQEAFARQTYPHKRLVIVRPDAEHEIDGEFVARFSAEVTYNDHHLEDLALATRYHDGPVIAAGRSFRLGQLVSTAEAIVRRDQLRDTTLALFVNSERPVEGLTIESDVEPMNIDGGVSLSTLLAQSDRITIAEADPELRSLGASDFTSMFADVKPPGLDVTLGPDGLTIESGLEVEGRQYLYQRGEFPLAALGFEANVKFHLDVTTGLRLQAVFLFFDQHKRRVGEVIRFAAMNHELEVPAGAVFVRFGVLAVGPGTATVRRLVLGHVTTEEPTRIVGRSRTLLVTNGYPATDALYRNAFIHRRVLDYRRAGVDVDVFCHRTGEPISYHEFEGTDVVSGRGEVLRRMLVSNAYDTVLVHFLDDEIWKALQPRLAALRVYLWIHGAEIHPWHRRRYNYTSPVELESAKTASKPREALWNSVLKPLHANVHLITVSRTFAAEIEEDYQLALPAPQHSVIHNVIDTELFRYEAKPAAQRTKILSIRPFATRQYANDLAVETIVLLSKQPWFAELDVHLIGDGPLFDSTVAPLRKLKNVVLERRFVRQDEIAALHKTHGVFLCPTRWDSQGVSRDEAMASGLVPVTTAIAAVPEFVDDECGFLAPPEDAAGLAAAIETLYRDPARFQWMSAAAAARVRRDRSSEQTSLRELALFSRRS